MYNYIQNEIWGAVHMIRLGICDDDVKILEILRKMIEEQYGGQVGIQTYKSPCELLYLCEENGSVPLDIVLIDILLKRENGIELAKKLQNMSRRVKIIFITGYLEYAADIFQIEPVYLLKKPISVIKLVEAIDKAIEKIKMEEAQCITLCSRGAVFRVNVSYVSYIESNNRKVLVHQNEEVISIYMKLDELEEKLGNIFLRCHHSYLVNMEFVKTFTAQEIELWDGTRIPVSRPKSAAAKERYLGYLGEKV